MSEREEEEQGELKFRSRLGSALGVPASQANEKEKNEREETGLVQGVAGLVASIPFTETLFSTRARC